jgi:hypothetical protein
MSFTNITSGLSTISNGVQSAINSVGGVARTASNIAANLGNLSRTTTVGGALNSINNIAGNVTALGGILNNVTNPAALGSAMRSMNLPIGGEIAGIARALASFGGGSGPFGGMGNDWRVKLSIPGPFLGSSVLYPLLMSDCSLIFPYTPTINITGSAGYEEQSVTHQNYQFIYYNSGKTEQIQINAPFNIEDQEQGLYWLAAVHFLRSATKMFTGNDPYAGNPPVICRLNGYGDYVFPNVPVIIKSFTMDMPADVNYIQAGGSHVPVKSSLNLTLQPIFSRTAAKNFSLTTFVNGGYMGEGYV